MVIELQQAVDFGETLPVRMLHGQALTVESINYYAVAPIIVLDYAADGQFLAVEAASGTEIEFGGQVTFSTQLTDPKTFTQFLAGKVRGGEFRIEPFELTNSFTSITVLPSMSVEAVDGAEFEPFTVVEGLVYIKSFEGTEIAPVYVTPPTVRLGTYTSTPTFEPFEVRGHNSVYLPALTGTEISSITVIPGESFVYLAPINSGEFSPIIVVSEDYFPLRFRRAVTPTGGELSRNYLAPEQYYYRPPPGAGNRMQLLQSPVTGILPDTIPSEEAIFSKTYYRAFYIVNDGAEVRTNIDFWVDGGATFEFNNYRAYEGEFFLEDEERNYNHYYNNREDVLLSGPTRTSLFDQIHVEYLLSKDLIDVGETGKVIGFDLTREQFTPGNKITRIDELEPGEYYGVYLKITTQFLPDFPIKTDYSFFHLRYTTPSNNLRETYPGQVTVPGSTGGQLLPSVYLKVRASYSGLEKELNQDVDFTYSKYPTFFIHKDEVSDG